MVEADPVSQLGRVVALYAHGSTFPLAVPPSALQNTVQLLAQLAPAVDFLEVATGRSTHSPLPVLR
jgi:hypothetical protein